MGAGKGIALCPSVLPFPSIASVCVWVCVSAFLECSVSLERNSTAEITLVEREAAPARL